MYKIPVLFVIFKRKDVSLRSLERLKEIKPYKLYIAGDGPRKGVAGEAEAVAETRKAILDAINWDCDVKTRFQEKNLGCSLGVYSAISWLFENEEYGIIIEDDCIMQKSFFPYVEELIHKYASDSRIGMICGANYAQHVSVPDSYVFSRYKSCHGWATWRRAWKLMDLDMNWRSSNYSYSVIANMGYKSKDIRYWKYRLKAIDLHDVSAWDWQWYFTLAANNMLAICPKFSLTNNIGFGEEATHTSMGKVPSCFSTDKQLEFPLKHPPYVVPYQPFEKAFYHSNNTLYNRIKQLFPFWFKNIVKKIVRG